MDSAWKKMKESVSNWAMLSDTEKKAQYDTFLSYADQKCLYLMLTELERIGYDPPRTMEVLQSYLPQKIKLWQNRKRRFHDGWKP